MSSNIIIIFFYTEKKINEIEILHLTEYLLFKPKDGNYNN